MASGFAAAPLSALSRLAGAEHRDHWANRGLAGFFDGTAWPSEIERPEFNYELAWMLLTTMQSDDRNAFHAFLVDAVAEDGGDAACRAHFGCTLRERAAFVRP